METRIIAITGPESTGKTTLANELAEHYAAICLPDISRKFIDEIKRPYSENDIHEIARLIILEEKKANLSKHNYVISDNCLINIKIWLEFYGWKAPNWLIEQIRVSPVKLHLLCDIDTDWVADSQRSNPNDREELLYRFMKELAYFDKNYILISGLAETRLTNSIEHINNYFL